MTTIFVSHAKEDTACAEAIRKGLETRGYSVWREPPPLSLKSLQYSRTMENALLGSAAIVVLWSSSAAGSEWVERHILLAQRLKKPLFPVILDGTDLPTTLIVDTIITSKPSCDDAIAQLLPHLPPAHSTDPLILLSEEAAHDSLISMGTRKAAIDSAAQMLQRGEHREAVLALLEYIARRDPIMAVRDKAIAVLEADAKKPAPPPPLLRPEDSRHIIGVRCKQCGHITYFDKRQICSAQSHVVRGREERAGAQLDTLDLPCEKCGHLMPTHVDCEGY